MKRILSLLVGVALVSGCAVTRGFITGATAGVQTVDEIVNGKYQEGSFHSAAKGFAHGSLMMGTVTVLWPVTAAVAGASGIYGAYQFYQYDRKLKAEKK